MPFDFTRTIFLPAATAGSWGCCCIFACRLRRLCCSPTTIFHGESNTPEMPWKHYSLGSSVFASISRKKRKKTPFQLLTFGSAVYNYELSLMTQAST